jgi:tRNA(fMet)-specific endonuclease VapC
MAYLIDTDMIIYSMKGNENVRNNFLKNEKMPKFISIITYGELLYGARKSEQTEKNCAKVYRLKNLFSVLPVDMPIIEAFSDIKSKYRKIGIVIDDFDLIIAATAIAYNQTLITNNTTHFAPIKELKLENWA